MTKKENKRLLMRYYTKAQLVDRHYALRQALIHFYDHGSARLRKDIEAITARASKLRH